MRRVHSPTVRSAPLPIGIGCAEPRQRLGETLLPERVFEGQRQDDAAVQTPCKVRDPAAEANRPLAHVGEPPLGRDPQRRPRPAQQRRAHRQEIGRPPKRLLLDAEETQPPEKAVLLQGGGVDGGVMSVIGREKVLEHQSQERVPPRRMIQDHDQRAVAGVGGAPAAGQADGVKVFLQTVSRIAGEDADQPRPRARQDRDASGTGFRGRRVHAASPSGGAAAGFRRNAPRSAAPSRSSASAAIQPDISTIGIPGPGWAAPPAK